MYTPQQFKFESEAAKIAFMKQYSFATIVTSINDVPVATQLPFFVDDALGELMLRSHFALANEQARYIAENINLVIFTEPHAYISPAHYEKKESVPTWDYIAVHAYGTAKIMTAETSKIQVLEEMISFYDPAYLAQWEELSLKFKQGMMKGIVAFEIEVTDLQGQKKLSQNKSAVERERIIKDLEQHPNSVESDLARYIREV